MKMNRKEFIQKFLLINVAISISPSFIKGKDKFTLIDLRDNEYTCQYNNKSIRIKKLQNDYQFQKTGLVGFVMEKEGKFTSGLIEISFEMWEYNMMLCLELACERTILAYKYWKKENA